MGFFAFVSLLFLSCGEMRSGKGISDLPDHKSKKKKKDGD